MLRRQGRDRPSDWLTLALQSAPMDATGTEAEDPDDNATDDELRAFGAKITKARKRHRGLTQRQVAEAAGVSLRTLSRMENGYRTTPISRRLVADYWTARNSVEPDTPMDNVDLGAVPSIALLAELARRVGVTEHRIGAAWPGPPVRVRWKTEDGPTESGSTSQQRRVHGHTEEA